MRIASFKITNYKSFRATDEAVLAEGFNVIVGPNNVGKTAMVEALGLHFSHKPHRSLSTAPRATTATEPVSQIEVSFEIPRDELSHFLAERIPSFTVPVPLQRASRPPNLAEYFLDAYLRTEQHVLRAVYDGNGNVRTAHFETFGAPPNTTTAIPMQMVPGDLKPRMTGNAYYTVDPSAQVAPVVAMQRRELVYTFRAERLNLGESPWGYSQILDPQARNLAEVLNYLQGNNPPRFAQFNRLVHTILDDITQVTVVPIPNASQIRVWTVDPMLERQDLAVPLAEGGTGVGQVLAILYVVLTSDYPRTIIIDEPQSFLHPGAVRKLIDVLRYESSLAHQFVITTHSPTAITAAAPRILHAVRKEDMESRIEPIDVAEAESIHRFLNEIGNTLVDVFGADNILWVEGATEERCFPLIYSRLVGHPLLGTLIRGVRHTGDFDRRGREARAAFEIYERLSTPRGLLPPAVGFIFDREGRTETQQADLLRQGRGRVHFTERRMYENYLLNPDAIVAVAVMHMEVVTAEPIEPVTHERVSAWLMERRWDQRFIDRRLPKAEQTEDRWLRDVHGPRLLAALFSDLSECQIVYDKVEHGEALTRWLLDHAPDDLQNVADLINHALSGDATALLNSGSPLA